MALSDKQRVFVDEYLVDLNATQAAIRAGYLFAENVPADRYYTYLLIDPRSGLVFYVGKGKGRRMSCHARLARLGVVDNAEKFRKITEIHSSGEIVVEAVFSVHEDEGDSFNVERSLISILRSKGLTNISGGTVTNDQRNKETALAMISRLRTFEEWVSQLGEDRSSLVIRVFGSHRSCYDAVFAELQRLAL
jgi:hypothetical protein